MNETVVDVNNILKSPFLKASINARPKPQSTVINQGLISEPFTMLTGSPCYYPQPTHPSSPLTPPLPVCPPISCPSSVV